MKNLEIIQHYLSNQIDNESIRKQNFKDLLITDESYSSQVEADHIYVNQTYEGIEILNSGGVFVIKNNKVVYSKLQLITDVQNKIKTSQPEYFLKKHLLCQKEISFLSVQ